MHRRDVFPVLYAGQQDSGSDHVGELAAKSLYRGLDNLQTPPRLSRRIASRDRFSIRTERRRACNRDDVPTAHCTRNANFRFEKGDPVETRWRDGCFILHP